MECIIAVDPPEEEKMKACIMLRKCLKPAQQILVTGHGNNPRDIWDTLIRVAADSSRSHVRDLQSKLNLVTISSCGNDYKKFCSTQDQIINQLSDLGTVLSDEDKLDYFIEGLDTDDFQDRVDKIANLEDRLTPDIIA